MSGGHARRPRKALAHLPERDPAAAVLALWCAHRDGEGPTATAGDTIRYGPEFEALPLHEQIGLAVHHVLHVALRHGARAAAMAVRREGFDADLYGLCTDAVINEALGLAGHALPRPAVTLTGLLSATLGAPASAEAALATWDADRLYAALEDAPGRAARDARAYGAARGFVRDVEPEAGPAADAERQAAEWRGRLSRAMAEGTRAGQGIGRLAPLLAELAPPRVPWERRLRRLLARALSPTPRQSWRRPSGRWLAMEAAARAAGRPVPVFQPGPARDGLRPRLAVGLDTSSSIPPALAARFAAEAAGAARRGGAETHLLAFDETVHLERRLEAGLSAGMLSGAPVRQGGGTDFRDALARADRLNPALIVVLTDLDGPMSHAPRAPVLWTVPAPPTTPPAFGEILVMDG
ncbi:hypothetical protein DXV76_00380 [Rhodobacteraceae bacterium CCMM004]|nr:hypothetical protein DXV76_00380 [Rhodobacteraceae bacterium CCMM004]